MTKLIKVITPDIGDFKDVPIIELLIKDGDTVEIDQPLITIESDKATMEIPSTHSGFVKKILIKVGDKISKGTPICDLQTENNEISKSDEKKLDLYEDFPILYKKFYFYHYGEKVMTYTMNKKSQFRYPTERYLNIVKRGYQDCKLDLKYLKKALV